MEVKLTLALPRDEYSVPVARRVLRESLRVLGVEDDVVSDIELALTEACTNVLEHAGDADDYELSAGIDGDRCVIEVVDRGSGFDSAALGRADAPDGAEDGRGIQLMRALVDTVVFESRPQSGTVVHLEKQLVWAPDSPVRRLTEGRAGNGDGPWSRDGRDDRAGH